MEESETTPPFLSIGGQDAWLMEHVWSDHPLNRDTTKPGLWTLDWTMDWTLDSIMGLDNWTRFSIVWGQRLLSGKVMMFLVL